MSETNANRPATADNRSQLLSILAALGCILLFLFILFITYLPDSNQDPLAQTEAERLEILRAAQADAAHEMASLEVVNPDGKIYKIPVDQAMELTVREYKEKQKP